MNYIIVVLIAFVIGLFIYARHIKDVNRDLRRQKQNLQTKIIQEQVHTNIKEFQAYQKAKKEEIKKSVKGKDEKSDINLSIGSHTYNF